MKNEVNVELSVGNIPKEGDKSHELVSNSLAEEASSVSNYIDYHPDGPYYLKNKAYDIRLLMRQLEDMDTILQSGSPSYSLSKQVPVSDINFDSYRDISKVCKSLDMSVTVSKYGSHIENCNDPSLPEYYNNIKTCYKDGKYESQIISHVEEDGSFYPDDLVVTLSGDECKSTLPDIKNEMTIRLKDMYKQNIQQQKKEEVVERNSEDIVDVPKTNDKSFDMDIV